MDCGAENKRAIFVLPVETWRERARTTLSHGTLVNFSLDILEWVKHIGIAI
jgi:hypothetical protein